MLLILDELENGNLKIAVHNIQSLRAHHETTQNDSSLMAADILGFVETRASRLGDTEFEGFSCLFERICPPYGTSIYVRPEVEAEVVVDIKRQNREGPTYIVEVTTIRALKNDETRNKALPWMDKIRSCMSLSTAQHKNIGNITSPRRS